MLYTVFFLFFFTLRWINVLIISHPHQLRITKHNSTTAPDRNSFSGTVLFKWWDNLERTKQFGLCIVTQKHLCFNNWDKKNTKWYGKYALQTQEIITKNEPNNKNKQHIQNVQLVSCKRQQATGSLTNLPLAQAWKTHRGKIAQSFLISIYEKYALTLNKIILKEQNNNKMF